MSENKTVGRQLEEIPIGWADRSRSFIARVLDDYDQRIKWLEEQSQKPREEPVYVGPRSFWDWLSELSVRLPERKNASKFTIVSALATIAICFLFFACWFFEFGADWAKPAVGITGLVVLVSCVVGSAYVIHEF